MRESRCVLFDWGNTLMRDFPEARGPMADWPRVETLPGVEEVLRQLRPRWTLALATNAVASDEPRRLESTRPRRHRLPPGQGLLLPDHRPQEAGPRLLRLHRAETCPWRETASSWWATTSRTTSGEPPAQESAASG